MDQQQLNLFRSWLQESRRAVFFGGAGVSTESGVPHFRSPDGLYHQQYAYPPEEILSRSFFDRNPETFYDFYREKILCCLDVQPNRTHRFLAALEEAGHLAAVVTQNIGGLHQRAGSRKVLELHGSALRHYCQRCGAFYEAEQIRQSQGVPRCSCGGLIKPDVVLYEESLDQSVLVESCTAIRQADLLIVGGTSLAVYPAAGLLSYYRGSRMVLINRSATPRDGEAQLVFREGLGDVFEKACAGWLPSMQEGGQP